MDKEQFRSAVAAGIGADPRSILIIEDIPWLKPCPLLPRAAVSLPGYAGMYMSDDQHPFSEEAAEQLIAEHTRLIS